MTSAQGGGIDGAIGAGALAPPPGLPDNRTAVPDDATATEYTIDELATATRVPSRTIRFYQSKGALPGPEIRGRVAFYGPAHVERLKLIGSLQDRGWSIRAIRDLLQQADKGEPSLHEWLGLENQLQEPWANDRPRVVTDGELRELLGVRGPGAIAEMIRLKQIERRGDSYLIHSPALLQVGLRLEAAGVDFETGAGAAAILRKHLGRAAAELSLYFQKRVGAGFGRAITATDLGEAYQALRPLGQEAVRVVFAQEMEREVRKLVDSGAATELARARKKRR
ncbi:MAG: MerR family transcriptional regulator [Myxococcales bacterium]|nr:MerR family transcriptional regulator [Myxococcales bacterium]